jgi:exonuclease VII small subunit
MSASSHIDDLSEPTELSFEAGYQRLAQIARRLNEDEVPVSEMCDLFAEGKGLEIALTGFLDSQRERVEAIDRGEGIRAFRITRTPAAAAAAPRAIDVTIDSGELVPAPVRSLTPPATGPAATGAVDDLPF